MYCLAYATSFLGELGDGQYKEFHGPHGNSISRAAKAASSYTGVWGLRQADADHREAYLA